MVMNRKIDDMNGQTQQMNFRIGAHIAIRPRQRNRRGRAIRPRQRNRRGGSAFDAPRSD
jgi:hypothetical protein